jgi:hypothetical protein
MSAPRRRLGAAALLVALALAGGDPSRGESVALHPICPSGLCGALVIVPEDRFDPLVQQLFAREQLSMLPSRWQPLFIVMPQPSDPDVAEAQIRFLHQLLSGSSED